MTAFPAWWLMLGQIATMACGVAAIKSLPATGKLAASWAAGLAAYCLALAVFIFLSADPPDVFWDFRSAYYPAGQAVLDEPAALAALIGKGVSGFVNLPIVAYMIAPFTALSFRYAIGLFTVAGLAMTALSWLFLVRLAGLKGTERWLLLLLFAANGPLLYSIREGNTSHWALAALAGGLYLLRAGRPAAAGALLGAAAVLKLPLLLFGVYFVLRRNWRATFGFATVCAAMAALSLIVFGWDFHLRWFELCILQFSSQWIAAFNVQSIQSFVFRLWATPEMLHDWTPWLPGPGQRLAGFALVGLLYLTAIWACVRAAARSGVEGSRRMDLEFLLVVCLAVVSSPLSWSHYYTWLLMPAAFHLGSRSPFGAGLAPRLTGWVAIVLAALLVRPLLFTSPTLMTGYIVLGASSLLFGGLLWIGLITWALSRTSLASRGMAMDAANPIRLPSWSGLSSHGAIRTHHGRR